MFEYLIWEDTKALAAVSTMKTYTTNLVSYSARMGLVEAKIPVSKLCTTKNVATSSYGQHRYAAYAVELQFAATPNISSAMNAAPVISLDFDGSNSW